MPLFVPASNIAAIQIARLNQRAVFFKLVGVSNTSAASNTWVNSLSFYENGEIIVGGDDNKIGFMTDLRQAKIDIFPAFPLGAPFSAGTIISPFRSVNNYGAGTSGSIFCVVAAAQVARSDDNGATWSNVTPPEQVGQTLRGIAELSNGRLWSQREGGGTDLSFSDNGGATWTAIASGQPLGGTSRRQPIMARDRSRIVFVANSAASLVWTDDLSGAPPTLNPVNLTVTTGQASGPGPSSMFDNNGGFFGIGDFGDFVYTADFLNYSLIADTDNPLVKGDNVGATTAYGAGYSQVDDGFIIASTATNASPGIATFFPRETITDPSTYTPISLDRSLVSGATFGRGESDIDGNFIVSAPGSDNVVWQSLISTFL